MRLTSKSARRNLEVRIDFEPKGDIMQTVVGLWRYPVKSMMG
jgi:hypothetical protein